MNEVPGLYEQRYLQAEVHENTFWLCVNPLMCGGFGCAKPTDPLKSTVSKCLCFEGYAWTEDAGDKGLGVIFDFQKSCCIVSHAACPPGGGASDGVPLLACCNKRMGGESGGQIAHQLVANIMSETFLLYYCLCFGCGFGRLGDPCILNSRKCFCFRQEAFTADCFVKDIPPFFNHDKCLCCVSACTMPCFGGNADGLPGCACCGQTIACPPKNRHER
eukprot:SRR837773.5369.p1 GENE.SRR837773.5369~~SRR837773.5369.p1  ORF type:complete len:234 (-),score=62.83 SRR837773.5369:57-710(-)